MSVFIPSSGGAPSGIIECRYAVNTNSAGASISADTWTALPITEFLDTNGHCSVSAGVMTLAAGTYRGFIEVTANRSTPYSGYAFRLANTSDTTYPILSPTLPAGVIDSIFPELPKEFGAFVIGSSKNFELQVFYDVAGTIGTALSGSSFSDMNILAKVYLEKIA